MRYLVTSIAAALAVAATASAFNFKDVGTDSLTLGNLKCGHRYQVTLSIRKNGDWTKQRTKAKNTKPCPPPPPPPSEGCTANATPADFASKVAGATAGQIVCLDSGNYGTWTGTNK